MEQIVRPFETNLVTPRRVAKPGIVGVPDIRIAIGFKGDVKTFSGSSSFSESFVMGNIHSESVPVSPAIQSKMAG